MPLTVITNVWRQKCHRFNVSFRRLYTLNLKEMKQFAFRLMCVQSKFTTLHGTLANSR